MVTSEQPEQVRFLKYKVASLFSGAGGLDLGFILHGSFDVRLACEILPAPVATYAHNFRVPRVLVNDFQGDRNMPSVVEGSVAKLDLSKVRQEFQLLVGGPPCQDFSIVRGPRKERAGIAVARGKLYLQFMRALIALKPMMFLFENVPGLITANSGHAYKTIIADFEELRRVALEAGGTLHDTKFGYQLLYKRPVSFKNLGVPQDRRRLIILGLRNDLAQAIGKSSLESLMLRVDSFMQGGSELFHTYPLTPMEVFEGKTLPHLQEKYRKTIAEYEGLWDRNHSTAVTKWKKETWDRLTFKIIPDYELANKITSFSREGFEQAMEQHSSNLQQLGYMHNEVPHVDEETRPSNGSGVMDRMYMIPPDHNHEFVRHTKWEVEGRGMSLIYRRIHPLKPAYTVVAYGGGGTWGYHYERSRAMLSMKERARLQTFPDSFEFMGSRSQVRAQIGEAVPPLAARKIAGLVFEILATSIQSNLLTAYA